MRLSVIFGTRGNEFSFPHLQRIFRALQQQTFQDFQVIVIMDRKFKDKEERDTLLHHCAFEKNFKTLYAKTTFFTNINSDFRPSSHNASNASYVRNYGIAQADTELIQLFDDDNAFGEEYLEKAVAYYDKQKQQQQTEVVICPSMYYRDTDQIQNQGFSHYNYLQSRPMVHYL
ncbi:MAG: glycosyltransferase family 2 protein [Candidatus Peribacteria bacterium]|jgi:glycosyltransferase involved in cell wall biosynthesis|nr:glycosyltransferase family 2 protein [Candidatus Peribacteria bacterium]